MHREENARENLDHEHQQSQRAEEVPEVEVFRREVTDELGLHELIDWQTLVQPGTKARLSGGRISRGSH